MKLTRISVISDLDSQIKHLCEGLECFTYRGTYSMCEADATQWILNSSNSFKVIFAQITHYLKNTVFLGIRDFSYQLYIVFEQSVDYTRRAIIEICAGGSDDALITLIGAMHYKSLSGLDVSSGSRLDAQDTLKTLVESTGGYIWLGPARFNESPERGALACQIQIPL